MLQIVKLFLARGGLTKGRINQEYRRVYLRLGASRVRRTGQAVLR
uniref:Uncharacterized protein n=1 Tax=uncultured bacterium A1Q1_fos_2004 TaxID=1256557 RepID=L7VTD1_9BACT|nr:hypothetical protein [uncultured bacterium A1Q1_fos_2004]